MTRKQNRRKPTITARLKKLAEMVRKLSMENLKTREVDVTEMYALQDAVNDAAYTSPIPDTSNAPKGA